MAIGSTTLAVVAITATVLSAATSMYAAQQQGKAAKAQADYQAAVARNNKIIADRQAEDAIKRGEVAEQERRLETRRLIAAQRATSAGSGVLVDEGSALSLNEDAAEQGEFEALTIRSNAAREAYGFRVQGAGFESDAGLFQLRGESARNAANIETASTAIGAAGSVASQWYGFKQKGTL